MKQGVFMKKKISYIVYQVSQRKWGIQRTGSQIPSLFFSSRFNAWAEARRLARGKGAVAVFKDTDGKVKVRNNYNDKE